MASIARLELIHTLIAEYGGDTQLQSAFEHEILKHERRMYLQAFSTDVEDMSLDTLQHVIRDQRTPTDILDIVNHELKFRPRRLAIQDALIERASKGSSGEPKIRNFIRNTPEFKDKEKFIVEVEETREERDIITLLNALNSHDDRLHKFDKLIIGITLGRTLRTWKRPLRPYIASIRFSKQDTMSSLYHFKTLAKKAVINVRPLILDAISSNFETLVGQCTLQDYNTLIRIHGLCDGGDVTMANLLAERIESMKFRAVNVADAAHLNVIT